MQGDAAAAAVHGAESYQPRTASHGRMARMAARLIMHRSLRSAGLEARVVWRTALQRMLSRLALHPPAACFRIQTGRLDHMPLSCCCPRLRMCLPACPPPSPRTAHSAP